MSEPYQSDSPQQALNVFLEQQVSDWEGLTKQVVGPELQDLEGGRIAFDFLVLRRSGVDGTLLDADRYHGVIVRSTHKYYVKSWDRESIKPSQIDI